MTDERDEQPDEADNQSSLRRWLNSFRPGPPTRSTGARVPRLSRVATDHFLRQAAKCYVEAQWADDACRIFEQVGHFARAAYYHEKQGRSEQAAHFYALAGQWRSAARCYLLCDSPVEAADCLLRVGQSLTAAWYLAHLAHHFVRAEAIARSFSPKLPAENFAVDLIVARCQTGTGSHAKAARGLRSVLEEFSGLLTMPHLIEWALAVAEAMRRPDMTALVYAAAVNSGVPDASEKWQQWTVQTLGGKLILPAYQPGAANFAQDEG